MEWSLIFPEAEVVHIDNDISDHLSILLKCKPVRTNRGHRGDKFRFENMWGIESSYG